MIWWKEIARLKQQLNETQAELQKEQGKAVRLAGFIGRLQHFFGGCGIVLQIWVQMAKGPTVWSSPRHTKTAKKPPHNALSLL